MVATNPELLKHKIGASVAAVRRAGGMTAVDTMNHFMLNKEIVPNSLNDIQVKYFYQFNISGFRRKSINPIVMIPASLRLGFI